MALRSLLPVSQIVAVVVAGGRDAMTGDLEDIAESHGVPILSFSDTHPLKALGADLFCVATFPRILGLSLLRIPALGTLNMHTSLLPRHRGPDPIFWAYFQNEAETGVTIHWMVEKVDAGDIVLQESIPIPRGSSGVSLYFALSEVGAALLARAVVAVANGTASRTPQDEALATWDSAPEKIQWTIDWDVWGAERLWHFLRGISHLGLGFPVPYERVDSYDLGRHDRKPGTVTGDASHWIVYTNDGRVHLSASAGLRRKIRKFASRVKSKILG